jgi:hypothetical protein
MAVYTLKHATLTGKDGAGSPISMTLSPGPVDFNIDAMEAGCVEAIPVYNGGTFLEMVEGPQVPANWSLTLLQDGKILDASTGKPVDLAMKTGYFASGTTTDPGSVVWMVDVVLVLTRAGVSSTLTLKNNRLKAGFSTAGDGNKIALTGTAYGTGSTLPVVWS